MASAQEVRRRIATVISLWQIWSPRKGWRRAAPGTRNRHRWLRATAQRENSSRTPATAAGRLG